MNMSTLVTCVIEFIGGSAQYNSGPLDAVSEMPSLDRIAGFCFTYQGALFLSGVGSYGGGSSLTYRVKVGLAKGIKFARPLSGLLSLKYSKPLDEVFELLRWLRLKLPVVSLLQIRTNTGSRKCLMSWVMLMCSYVRSSCYQWLSVF